MGKGGKTDKKVWICVAVVVLVPFALFAIAKFVIAKVHEHDCTLQERVPTYLWVSGGVPYVLGLGLTSSKGSDIVAMLWTILILFFNVIWTIVGSVWIFPAYTTYKADDFLPCNETITVGCTDGYCNNVLITFAFGALIADWVVVLATLIVCVGVCVLVCRDDIGGDDTGGQSNSNPQDDSVPKLVFMTNKS